MASQDLHPGLRVGRYLLEERRGRGGFGEVWRARPLGGGDPVALKFALDPAYVRFLKREGVLQHTIAHPGVVRTLEVRTDHDPPYVAMEYVEGPSLRERLDAGGPLKPRDAENLLFKLLEVLEHTHALGIIHRDLKPSNVLICERSGKVKLTDFGLGQVTGRYLSGLMMSKGLVSGSVPAIAGTFAYQAPEAWIGEEVTARADLYALGVVLFEVVTGRLPAGLELPSQLRFGLPRRFDRAFRLCYTVDPAHRAASAAALRSALTATPAERMAPLFAGSLLAVPALAIGLGLRPLPEDSLGLARDRARPEASVAAAPGAASALERAAPHEGAAQRAAAGAAAHADRARAATDGAGDDGGAADRDRAAEAAHWLHRGRALEADGAYARAVACYELAVELAPDAAEPRRALERAEALRGEAARAASGVEEAARLVGEYLELRAGTAPGVPRYYGVAKAARARELYRRALDQHPAALGELEALDARLGAERAALVREAEDAAARERFAEAYATLRLAASLTFDEDEVTALELRLAELAAAERAAGDAAAEGGARPDQRLRRGDELARSGDYEAAAIAYEEAIALGAADGAAADRLSRARFEALRRRADQARARGRLAEAEEAYRDALRYGDAEGVRAALAAVRAELEVAESNAPLRAVGPSARGRRGGASASASAGAGAGVGVGEGASAGDPAAGAPAGAAAAPTPAAPLELRGHHGFLRPRQGATPTYYVYGRLAAQAALRGVVVSFRYFDADGNVIHARTRRLPRVQRFVTYPLEDEVFDSRTAERIAGYRVALFWTDADGGYRRLEAP